MAHIDEDNLELYALERLIESEAAPIGEHLLICDNCRERLAGCEEYVRAMQVALRGLSQEVPP